VRTSNASRSSSLPQSTGPRLRDKILTAISCASSGSSLVRAMKAGWIIHLLVQRASQPTATEEKQQVVDGDAPVNAGSRVVRIDEQGAGSEEEEGRHQDRFEPTRGALACCCRGMVNGRSGWCRRFRSLDLWQLDLGWLRSLSSWRLSYDYWLCRRRRRRGRQRLSCSRTTRRRKRSRLRRRQRRRRRRRQGRLGRLQASCDDAPRRQRHPLAC
jgi:hypothetical protein